MSLKASRARRLGPTWSMSASRIFCSSSLTPSNFAGFPITLTALSLFFLAPKIFGFSSESYREENPTPKRKCGESERDPERIRKGNKGDEKLELLTIERPPLVNFNRFQCHVEGWYRNILIHYHSSWNRMNPYINSGTDTEEISATVHRGERINTLINVRWEREMWKIDERWKVVYDLEDNSDISWSWWNLFGQRIDQFDSQTMRLKVC